MSAAGEAMVTPGDMIDLDAGDLGRAGDVVAEMMEGTRLGVIVRNVFSAEQIRAFRAGLEAPGSPFASAPMSHFEGRQFGRALVVSPPDLQEYFVEAARLRAAFVAVDFPFESRLKTVLASIGGAFDVCAPRHANGNEYGLATIRMVKPGGEIDLHCENETVRFPAMAHLASLLDLRTQLSFYVPLERPDAGGELRVYPARHGEGLGGELDRLDRRDSATLARIEADGWVAPDPREGDMIVFDAGRRFHRVTRVLGARARWTMGGFLALSVDRRRLYYWS